MNPQRDCFVQPSAPIGRTPRALTVLAGALFSAVVNAAGPAAGGCFEIESLPLVSSTQSQSLWVPFVAEVSARSGLCLRARTASNLAQANARLLSGEPDFAMPSPAALVASHRRIAYRPLVASDGLWMRGILVVPKDSRLRGLEDLRDVRVGVTAAEAWSHQMLRSAGLGRTGVRCQLVELGTAANVLRAVAAGRVDVGASVDLVMQEGSPNVRDGLRVILETRAYLPPPLVAHPRVPTRVSESLARTIFNMQSDPSGRRLLRGVHLQDPVRVDYERYRADVGHLDLSTDVCGAAG